MEGKKKNEKKTTNDSSDPRSSSNKGETGQQGGRRYKPDLPPGVEPMEYSTNAKIFDFFFVIILLTGIFMGVKQILKRTFVWLSNQDFKITDTFIYLLNYEAPSDSTPKVG